MTILVAVFSNRINEMMSMRAGRASGLAMAALVATLVLSTCTPSATGTPAPSPTPPPCPAETDRSTCILVLGDSIAAGDGVTGPNRWPAVLQALLRVDLPNEDITVSNWAQGGSRIELLERRVEELPLESYDIAIVITGVNDPAVRSIDEWAPRYVAAIEKLEEIGVVVVIGTAPPTLEGAVFTGEHAEVAQALRVIADDRPLLDIEREWHDLGAGRVAGYYLDPFHPNEAGQADIAERARALVGEILGGRSEAAD